MIVIFPIKGLQAGARLGVTIYLGVPGLLLGILMVHMCVCNVIP